MGRYYSGDIEGKFWFAIQDSNDANFFGCEGRPPSVLEYDFDEDEHLDDINKGIIKCLTELGEFKEKIDNYFKERNGYNDETMSNDFNIPVDKLRDLLRWYARLQLGEKILKYVLEHGQCHFEAEVY